MGLAAFLTARWSAHWSVSAILVVAGLIGAAVMVVIGLPALRVGGLALAVTTMGFAVVAADWLYHQSWLGPAGGFATVSPLKIGPDLGQTNSMLSVYYSALAVLVLGIAAAVGLRRYGPGRLVIATRDNELATSSFGLNPAALKLAILAVSGFFAAAAGVLWADAWRVVSYSQFSSDLSIGILALPVIGGLGSIGGSVTAAVMLYMGTFFIGPQLSGLFGSFGQNLGFQLFLAGVTTIGVLLGYPRGIAGAVQHLWQKYLDSRAARLEAWAPPIEVTTARTANGPPPPNEIRALTARANANAELNDEARPSPPGGSGPLLETRGIAVHFGGVVALADPDICVAPGELVGLIGPNGAGKTTLINVISGLLKPDRGSVRIYGREVADLPPDFRAAYGVARSFQDARLFGGLSVIETIQTALAYRHKVSFLSAMAASPWARVTEIRTLELAEEIADRFGLTPWADTLTSELSTGTKRICDLAAQVATGPRLLLLDEPTAGVAQREAEAFGPLLRRVRDELECSVLIVEHDMPLLMGLCDRVYAMEAGRVIAVGTPDEIRSDPAVVESYLGNQSAAIHRSGARQAVPAGSAAGATPTTSPRKAAAPRKPPVTDSTLRTSRRSES